MRRIPTAEIKIADGLEEKDKIHYILWEAAKPPFFVGTGAVFPSGCCFYFMRKATLGLYKSRGFVKIDRL